MEQLTNYGLAGCVILIACAGIAYTFKWASTMLTKQMEAREQDLLWHRTEIDKKRHDYLEAEQLTQSRFTDALKRIEDTFTNAIKELCVRLDKIEEKLR